MSENKMSLTKLIGSFVFVFGIFFLLLSIVNIFNDINFIQEYKSCVEISNFDPSVIDICKTNVSEGLDLVIRANQVELSTGQYLRVYIKQIIDILFAILLIIVGDFLFKTRLNKSKKEEIKKPIIKTKKRKTIKKVIKRNKK